MRRRTLLPLPLLAALLALPLLASSCAGPAAAGDWLDPTAGAATPVPTDWLSIGNGITPAPVVAVAPGKVPASRLALPEDAYGQILPTSDGGALWVADVAADPKDTTGASGRRIRAIRYTATGAVAWDRTDGTTPALHAYVGQAVLFADGGYAVVLHEATGSATGTMQDRILRYAADGTPRAADRQPVGEAGAFEHVFALADGTLLAAGTAQVFEGGTQAASEIVLTRIPKDSATLEERRFARSDGVMLYDADWAEGTGLVAVWRTMVQGEGGSTRWDSTVGLFGEDLAERWTKAMPAGLGLTGATALADGKGLYLAAQRQAGDPAQALPVLLLLDKDGTTRWERTGEGGQTWFLDPVLLKDGRTLVAHAMAQTAGGGSTEVLLLSAAGEPVSAVARIPGFLTFLAGTKDGGATLCTRQAVKPLPQPPYISSMWQDTRAVVAHLDGSLTVTWTRVIDQFKNALRGDVVVPTSEGRLLVG